MRQLLYVTSVFYFAHGKKNSLHISLAMSSENIPQEYFNCFNLNDELPPADPMEVEELQQDLYDTVAME